MISNETIAVRMKVTMTVYGVPVDLSLITIDLVCLSMLVAAQSLDSCYSDPELSRFDDAISLNFLNFKAV